MLQTEIRRQVAVTVEPESVLAIVAEEAENVLGYKSLSATIGTKAAPLYRALAELGIEILDSTDVKRYQYEHQVDVAEKTFAAFLQDARSPQAGERYLFYSLPTWVTCEIQDYIQPIPEFVLNKAIQIRKTIPEVRIFVEFLNESLDPFLKVEVGEVKHCDWDKEMKYSPAFHASESYYIEVWEEPKFEGRLR